MTARLPFLDIEGPDGQRFAVGLDAPPVTIGRLPESNTVALEPDPQKLVTRKVHCLVESEAGSWWVVDNGSVNGTFLERNQQTERVLGRAPLSDGDVVCILGRLTETEEPVYWKLTFRDPLKTEPVVLRRAACLDYDWIRARLTRVEGGRRVEVRGLRPQAHKLIRFMFERNRANGNMPVLCLHEELAAAVWGEETDHTRDELVHLIWELRRKLEPDPTQPRLLQLERGLGYRLVTCPESG